MIKIGTIITTDAETEKSYEVIRVEDQYYAGIDAFCYPAHKEALRNMSCIMLPEEWAWTELYVDEPDFYSLPDNLLNKYSIIRGSEAKSRIEELLVKSETGVLALSDSVYPYAIPINHAWDGHTLYMHCGKKGKKLNLIRKNANASYMIYEQAEPNVDKLISCHLNYESALLNGRIRICDSADEKEQAVFCFTERYGTPYKHGMADAIEVLVFEIDYVTMRTGRFIPQKEKPMYFYNYKMTRR